MSSFFTVPGAQKKRKRAPGAENPKKKAAPSRAPRGGQPKVSAPSRRQAERDDESISGSDDDSDDGPVDNDQVMGDGPGSDSENEGETAAEKRLRLAERYLENVRQEVDEAGFDAADIDRDIIAERLQEDVAESKGKVYRQLAHRLAFEQASHSLFRANTHTTTSVATCAPHAYTVSKDRTLIKWKLQDLPHKQWPQTTKKKPKKPDAPPKRKPEKLAMTRGQTNKAKDKDYKGHTGDILSVVASQDGKFVVTAGADKRLIVHDAKTLRPLRVFTHHRDAVTGLAFRRGTNQLYSASKDRTVKVWSLDELAYIETLFGHQDHVVDIDSLAQERCLSVGSRDRTARLWKVVEETQLVFRGGAIDRKNKPDVDPRSLAHEGSMDRVSMIDEELFVTGSDNGSIALWSTQKKKPLHVLPLAHGLDPPLAPTQASAEKNPDPKKVVPPPQPRWITALRTLPYSDVILSGSWDGQVRVWQLSEDKKKIEPVGVLGGGSPKGSVNGTHNHNGVDDDDNSDDGEEDVAGSSSKASKPSSSSSTPSWSLKGVVNDISLFERGKRGKDGLCVVVAVGKEHRLGNWKKIKNGKNGAVVFEIPRRPEAPGDEGEDGESDVDDVLPRQ
ncbi:WD40-repeat-containing domain protein [Microdochium trichocladiopsis]|uniref:WD40-repeat-containing domain protein n=1 Tax=Microdochium trichocladiopsis TaxID=1682393 RepID=A0A9P9BVG7_9PEZI|nr:WD40-repeat-containing domain protein [Microdochium trichocladiopsis]KAH7033327.1 WD40-repeat-containing domain protein [Microdochium trichocladiopsis]